MKRKAIFVLMTTALFCVNQIYAKKVEIKDAKQVAVNFYIEHSSLPISAKTLSITQDYTVSENSTPLYYVFNFSNNGFVIISADDAVPAVLGYSYEGAYTEQNQPPQFMEWMDTYKKEISQVINKGLPATPEITAEWTRLNVSPESFSPVKGTRDVAPLMLSTWDQGGCYNELCPADAASSAGNGKVWAGCVATSLAQELYYYRYPTTGTGSHSYTPWSGSYGTQSANFGTTTYDWNAMTLTCNGSNSAISTLLYHCGVAVNMNYGPDGSSASVGGSSNSSEYALKTYFKYSSSLHYEDKDSYTDAQWETLIKTDLDNKRPLIYTGSGAQGGHAFNLDGYQGTNYFHFNWGWSGTANGYYYLTNLNPAGDDFTQYQGAIFNVYPASGFPYGCTSSAKTVTASTGTVEDGSGPSDYTNNQDCFWLLDPTEVIDHIKITFNYLTTEATNDRVRIYNGSDTTATLLGTYSGTTLPAMITSTSPTVLVRFTTNGSSTAAGWMFTYNAVYPLYCTGVSYLTAATDTFSDGSGANPYNNSTNCRWQIKPAGAGSVTVHFIDFNTEATNDKVRVINNANSATLATYSGSTLPADVTVPGNDVIVWFTCNSSVNGAGWTAYYTSTPSGVEDYSLIKDLSVYPNPAAENLHISFTNTGKDATVQLINITGQIVFSSEVIGNFSKDFDVSQIAKGIYNLKILASGETINKKIVVE